MGMGPHPATRTMALISRAAGGVDGDGNDLPAVNGVTKVVGLFAPGASAEQTHAQDRVTSQPQAILEPGHPAVGAGDAIVPDPALDSDGDLVLDTAGHPIGAAMEVDGLPEVWSPGTVIKLKVVTG